MTRTTNSSTTSTTTCVTKSLTQTTDKSFRANNRQTGDDQTLQDRYPNFTLDQIKLAFRRILDGLDQEDSYTDSISSYTCSKGSSCSDCSTSTDPDRKASQGQILMDKKITPHPAKKPRLKYDPLLTSTRLSERQIRKKFDTYLVCGVITGVLSRHTQQPLMDLTKKGKVLNWTIKCQEALDDF